MLVCNKNKSEKIQTLTRKAMLHIMFTHSPQLSFSAANTSLLSSVSTQKAAMFSPGQASAWGGSLTTLTQSARRTTFLSGCRLTTTVVRSWTASDNSNRATPCRLAGWRANQYRFHFCWEQIEYYFLYLLFSFIHVSVIQRKWGLSYVIRSSPSGGICLSGNEHASGLLNISIKKFLKSTSCWRYGCNYALSQSLIYPTRIVWVRYGPNLVQLALSLGRVFVNGMCFNTKARQRCAHQVSTCRGSSVPSLSYQNITLH